MRGGVNAPALALADPEHRPIFALVARLISIACFSAMGILVKLVGEHGVALPEVLFWRQAFALPVILLILTAGDGLASVRTSRFPLHLQRMAVGLASMACAFGSFTYLSVTQATTISFVAPIFATLIGILYFREKIGIRRSLAIGAGFLGVLIAMQPTGEGFNLVGVTIALAAALIVGILSHQIRAMSRTETSNAIVFWFSLLGAIVMAGFMPFFATAHDGVTWLMLLALGSLGGVAQIFMTLSLKHAPVSTVVGMDYTALIWTVVADWIIWLHAPQGATLLGAAIIAASGFYIVWREHRLNIERRLMRDQ